MATTRIMPIHPNKSWGAAQTVKHVTDYVKNPTKTNGGILVTGFECDPNIVTEDFMLSRDEYLFTMGRTQGESEILAYHVRQSFLPGETDVETASKLGYALAMELTEANHAFIVCTHTDKAHLHNHIIISAVNLSCDKKFRNEIASFKRVQEIADRLSIEHNLSVVEHPNLSEGTKNRYRKPTKRDGLVVLIDKIFETTPPKDFDDFLNRLEKNGCKIKQRGKTISVQPPGAKRFFRFKSGKKGLPDGYDEESLRKKIAEKQSQTQADSRDDGKKYSEPKAKTAHTTDEPPKEKTASNITLGEKIRLLIDIENSLKAKGSVGYERWAKGFNLQQAAETLLFLQTNNLTNMNDLTQAANQAKFDFDAIQKRIDVADTRIKEVNILQRHIGAYRKNRDIYSQYLRSKRNPKFRQENEKAIATVEEAKAFFDALGLEKLPTIKELQAEYSALSQEKHNCYQAKNDMNRYVFDLQSAKKNAEMLLRIDGEQRKERTKKKRQDADR